MLVIDEAALHDLATAGDEGAVTVPESIHPLAHTHASVSQGNDSAMLLAVLVELACYPPVPVNMPIPVQFVLPLH